MTIFIGTAGFPNIVINDLALILTGDVGLGVDQNPPRLPTGLNPGQAVEVRYDQTIDTPIHDRIFDIVTDHGYDVLIAGLGSNDRVPAAGNQQIWTMGGFTFQSVAGPIVVFYDALRCNNEGTWVMGLNGQPIDAFSTDGLFHELSHAFHFGVGDNVNPTVDETVAINEENVLRQLFGMPLRDPGNHRGGCNRTRPSAPGTPNEPTNTETSTFGKVECFIASAAYGDGNAVEVNRLRYLRDKYLRQTIIGARLFEGFSKEYYRFSPEVARAMRRDTLLRTVVTQTLVRPLFAFLNMADVLFDKGADSAAFGMIVEKWAKRFKDPGFWTTDDAGTAPNIEAYKALVRNTLAAAGGTATADLLPMQACAPLTVSFAEKLQWTAAQIQPAIGPNSCMPWMLGEPISLSWDFIDACHQNADQEALKKLIRQAVREWMGRMPLSVLVNELPEDKARKDLDRLRRLLFSDPIVDHHLRSLMHKLEKQNG